MGNSPLTHVLEACASILLFPDQEFCFAYTFNAQSWETSVQLHRGTEAKQLCLILDLDHTLLNSVHIAEMTPKEEDLLAQVHGVSNGSLFRIESMGMVTKLRPFVRCFLKEARKMFKMYVYTKGNKRYALEMAKLLDPHGKYFGGRVFSRDDPGAGTNQKLLQVVGVRDTDAVIVDDAKSVWRRHEANLVQIEPYHFFARSGRSSGLNGESYFETKRDEARNGGALQVVLGVLRRVHCLYNAQGGDVRPLLDALRKDVLKGCSLVLDPREAVKLRDLAERFGARCSIGLEPSATHVVSVDFGAKRSRWGRRKGKPVVRPGWISASCCKWEKQPEAEYALVQ